MLLWSLQSTITFCCHVGIYSIFTAWGFFHCRDAKCCLSLRLSLKQPLFCATHWTTSYISNWKGFNAKKLWFSSSTVHSVDKVWIFRQSLKILRSIQFIWANIKTHFISFFVFTYLVPGSHSRSLTWRKLIQMLKISYVYTCKPPLANYFPNALDNIVAKCSWLSQNGILVIFKNLMRSGNWPVKLKILPSIKQPTAPYINTIIFAPPPLCYQINMWVAVV